MDYNFIDYYDEFSNIEIKAKNASNNASNYMVANGIVKELTEIIDRFNSTVKQIQSGRYGIDNVLNTFTTNISSIIKKLENIKESLQGDYANVEKIYIELNNSLITLKISTQDLKELCSNKPLKSDYRIKDADEKGNVIIDYNDSKFQQELKEWQHEVLKLKEFCKKLVYKINESIEYLNTINNWNAIDGVSSISAPSFILDFNLYRDLYDFYFGDNASLLNYVNSMETKPGISGANQRYMNYLFWKYYCFEETNDSSMSLSNLEYDRLNWLMKVFASKSTNLQYSYINKYLAASSEKGCAFASAATVLARIYSNMPNGETYFVNKYGFPLYYNDENNQQQINYDLLFTKLFIDSFDENQLEYMKGYPYDMIVDKIGSELYNDSNIHLDEFILIPTKDSHSYSSDLTIDFSDNSLIDDCRTNLDNGYCAILCITGDLEVRCLSDNNIYSFENVMHAMPVEYINSNNNFVVSTWGEDFEIMSIPSDSGLIFVKAEDQNG